MSSHRIALLFEYSTLNGGERSMLAVLDALMPQSTGFDFVAIAPPEGRLADSLRRRKIPVVDWSSRYLPYREHAKKGGLEDATCVSKTIGPRPPIQIDFGGETQERRVPVEEIESSLIRIVSDLKPDLIHANSLAMGRLMGRLAGQLNVKSTAHLRDIIKLSSSAIADLNRNIGLVAVSEATRQFHHTQGISLDCMEMIHNGVDLEEFQPRPSTGWLRTELGLPLTTKLIATIGQIGLRKGQDVLAAAARSIVERVPNAHFAIVGERHSKKAESVEFEREIQQRFESDGLSDRLHLLGNREDVAGLLNEIDLLVHPANQEPLGRVLLEASATGVPIVATNVGGTAEIVINGETGLLVPPRDPDALAEAVSHLLLNPENARQLGAVARQRAEQEFSIPRAASRLKTFWKTKLDIKT